MTRSWRTFRKSVWALILALGIATLPARAAPVDDYIRSEMRKMGIPGLSIVVIRDRKIVKIAGYGSANLETRTPATPDSIYKIASLSKPFIASAILDLAADRKIGLDDRISQHLTGTPDSWKDITIRQVLTHTSGIPRDPNDYHPYQEQKPMAVIASAYTLPLSFKPGEKFLYSNVGYYILAQIIENATGAPWEGFVAARVFKPAGLQVTRPLTAAIVPDRAAGYDRVDGRLVNAENWVASRPSSAFLSSVRDLARWDIFLDDQRSRSPAFWEQTRTLPMLPNGRTGQYGLGWYVETYLGHARIHHDGQYPGFRSTWERFEDDKLTIIILTNSGQAPVESLALKVAGFYVPALAAPTFNTSVNLPTSSVASGSPVTIGFTLRAGKAAPKSVLELEIWDSENKAVYKQTKSGQDFAAGEGRRIDFQWTPAKPGKYWINLGIYGPKFTPNYAWAEHIGALTVN
ncbi:MULTISPECIES: serine hydrolase [unclassified Sphingomonas]|jgi:CubicO group peptidase (beta-lactamase class C family)|nr:MULTISPECIES: serine hydrolase [unclassified Sphingomonas]